MFYALEQKAKSAAQGIALSAIGGIAICVGLGFLTAAAWIYLVTVADTLIAASVIGGTYVGVGLITIGLSSSKSTKPTVAAQPAQDAQASSPPLMQAFLHGMQAGATAQRR